MTTWAQAFREQSLSDFHAGSALLGISGCHSQATMLLLVAWEKLAKSVLGEPPSPRATASPQNSLRVCRQTSNVWQLLGKLPYGLRIHDCSISSWIFCS